MTDQQKPASQKLRKTKKVLKFLGTLLLGGLIAKYPKVGAVAQVILDALPQKAPVVQVTPAPVPSPSPVL